MTVEPNSLHSKGKLGAALERPLVVGVDGTNRNQSAVSWAVDEALRSGRPLALAVVVESVHTVPPRGARTTGVTPSPSHDQVTLVNDLRDSLKRDHPTLDITRDVRFGPSLHGALEASHDAHMVIVGKRQIGTIERFKSGSTSTALAGRSPVPTIIVPDAWVQADHADESILVAIDPSHDNDNVLNFAFERAEQVGATLVIMHIWETHPAVVLEVGDVAEGNEMAKEAVRRATAGWAERFPTVLALPTARHGRPAEDLLEAGEHAQLLVVGRRSSGSSPFGFSFGSLTRGLLHHCSRPVAVVPSGHASE